jgi:hypothetical protein
MISKSNEHSNRVMHPEEGATEQNPSFQVMLPPEGATGKKRKRSELNLDPEPLERQSGPAAAAEQDQSAPERAKPPINQESDQARRSGRNRQPAQRLIEAMVSEVSIMTATDVEGEIFCLQSLYPKSEEQYLEEDPLKAYKATSDPDTMYLHEAMRKPDRKQFL